MNGYQAVFALVVMVAVQSQGWASAMDRAQCYANPTNEAPAECVTQEHKLIEVCRRDSVRNIEEITPAIRTLGSMRSTNAIPVLIDRLAMNDPRTKSYPAIDALWEIGTNSVPALCNYLLAVKDAEVNHVEIINAGLVMSLILGRREMERWRNEHREDLDRMVYLLLDAHTTDESSMAIERMREKKTWKVGENCRKVKGADRDGRFDEGVTRQTCRQKEEGQEQAN